MPRALIQQRWGRLGRGELPLQWRVGLLALTSALTLFVLFAGIGTLLADESDDESARRRAARHLAVARQMARAFDLQVEEQLELLERSAEHSAATPDHLVPQERAPLRWLPHARSYVSNVFVTDRTGHLLWVARPELGELDAELGGHPFVREPVATGARYVSGVHGGAPDGRPIVVFAVPIRDPTGQPIGVLGASIDANHFAFRAPVASAQHLGETGYAELVDQDLRSIVSSEPDRVLRTGRHPEVYRSFLGGRPSGVARADPAWTWGPAEAEGRRWRPAPPGPLAPAQERGQSPPPRAGTTFETPQRHLMAFVPLESVPWGVAVGDADTVPDTLADRWRQMIALLGVPAVGAALFLAHVTRRCIVGPVVALTGTSRRIAGGDLATPVPHVGDGEVRALAEALDDMRLRVGDALQAAALEKGRYQGIVDSITDAVFTTDNELRITAFNAAAEALTGWRAHEVVGKRCSQTVLWGAAGAGGAPELRGAGEACDRSCPLPSATPVTSPATTQVTIRRRDGRPVAIETTRSVIRGPDGAPLGVVHELRDATPAEEVGRLREEFLATVTHELRSPLGCIKGYATTLLLPDGLQDERATRRCLELIAEASEEMHELVDDLRDMTKIRAGTLDVHPAPVELRPLALLAVERVRPLAGGHDVRAEVPARLPAVQADAHRVEQVLSNLLDNAIKYSPEGGRIDVVAEAGAGEVCVGVADEGLGIPPVLLGSLFERFHREDTARTRTISGTGLGLAICKGIVEAHGGRIWAESPAPGRPPTGRPGTVVRFTLPIAGPFSPGRPPAVEAAAPAAGGAEPTREGPP